MKQKRIPKHHHKRLLFLSTYFRELRFAEGMTQEELSHNLNLHRNTIQRAESGQNITLLSIFELADALDIRIKDLFQDIE
jgi:transcriptional regulator with XRE-family HTH domain